MADAHNTIDIYVTALKNAHALGAETRQVLQRQAGHVADYPELEAKLREQAAVTDTQLGRLDGVLSGLGASASSFKDAVTSTIGGVAELGHGLTGDAVLKDLFVAKSFAGLGETAYASLIVSAELAGQAAAAAPFRQSLQEHKSFAAWIDDNVDPLTRDYTAKAAQGRAHAPS